MSLTKLFGNTDDFRNWDKWIQHCDIIENLTDIERERAKRAFRFLRSEFGEDFLAYVFDKRHPLLSYIVNLAPWTRKWIIRFVEALKELKDVEGYNGLVQRLKDKDKFPEGESVLEVAYRFLKAGFKIVIDPSTSPNRKVPDLEIMIEEKKEHLFVEVSVQRENMAQIKATRTMDGIMEPLWQSLPFLNFCGKIHKSLSEKHLAEVLSEIKKTIGRMRAENAFQELIIEDTVELGFAPIKDKDLLEKWAKSRGLGIGELNGPSVDVDELQRTRMKIQKEQKQLPLGNPNILVVRNENLYFSLKDVKAAINELEECVYEFSHILFVIVTGSYTGPRESETIMKDQHLFIKRSRDDWNVQEHIILLNRYCAFDISPATISKVYVAFGKY
jgi:hypothetical protein